MSDDRIPTRIVKLAREMTQRGWSATAILGMLEDPSAYHVEYDHPIDCPHPQGACTFCREDAAEREARP